MTKLNFRVQGIVMTLREGKLVRKVKAVSKLEGISSLNKGEMENKGGRDIQSIRECVRNGKSLDKNSFSLFCSISFNQ